MDNAVSNETRFLHAIQLGVGAMAWGDRAMWGYGRTHTEQDVRQAFASCLAEGITFMDTAEVYGSGQSERLLGVMTHETEQPVLIATKWFPMPWRLRARSFARALRQSLSRLRRDSVDLYQVNWPTPLMSVETMMQGMRECVEEGLTRTAGVSNFDQSQMLRAYSALAQHNIPLASNQVHYSLLHRDVEKNGLLARCNELGVRLISYSPLELGLLSGKYSPENPPSGLRAMRYARILPRLAPLVKLLTEIGQDHGGKANAQVALNWAICKGTLPIPGAKNADQALQNAGALGWSLTDDEVTKLDAASDEVTG